MRTLLPAFMLLACCSSDPKTDEEQQDTAHSADADADTDADADADTDADADADTDADADADNGDDTSAPPAPPPDPDPLNPDVAGPFSVGTLASRFTGSWGEEIIVQLWYPSLATEGEIHTYATTATGVALDRSPPACSQSRPLLIWSHGNHSSGLFSAFLAEHLASHGFVVAAPEHTGNTYMSWDDSRLGELAFRRPVDIADTADWVFGSAATEIDGLAPCVDADAGYAVSGHSFGGYTAIAVGGASFDASSTTAFCSAYPLYWLCDDVGAWVAEHPEYATQDLSDDRVWATVPMAPAGFEVLIGGLHQVEVPALYLGGGSDAITSMVYSVNLLYDPISSEQRFLGELIGGGHSSFIDVCDLWPGAEHCADEYIDDAIGLQEVNTTTLAFLRLALGETEMTAFLPSDSPHWIWTEGSREAE